MKSFRVVPQIMPVFQRVCEQFRSALRYLSDEPEKI